MPLALPLSDQKKMTDFVDRRHPAYGPHLPHWRFCESTFEGGRDWFAWNIHAYLKEGTREYADRLGRAYRFNHTREVVQLVTKYIFKEGVIRNDEDADPALRAFWGHATLDGEPIDALMKQICNQTSIAGRVWVAIDNRAPAGILTRADEKKGRARIYAYLVKQQDVLDFSRDEWGGLNWVLYRLKHRDDGNPVTSSGEVMTRYMLWTRDEWVLLEEHIKGQGQITPAVTIVTDPANNAIYNQALVNGVATVQSQSLNTQANPREIVLVERGPNRLGEVPVIAVDHIENSEHYAPPGLIDEIAYLDRAVANYLSNLDAVIQDQTFSQLVMPGQGLMPGEEAYDKMVEMGTKRIFLYDGEAQKEPKYISPDAAQASLIISVIKTIIGEIYHSVGMAGERTKQDNAQGIDNSSGVAKAYDFDRMNALLCAKADMLNQAEERIAHLVLRWAGKADPIDPADTGLASQDATDRLVKYPDSYDVRGLPDEFEIAMNLNLLEAPETVRRQQMSIIIDKLFPRLAARLKAAMEKDLADWPADPADQAAEMEKATTSARMGAISESISKMPQGAGAGAAGGAGGSAPGAAGGASGAPRGGNGAGLAGPRPVGKSKQGQNNKGAGK